MPNFLCMMDKTDKFQGRFPAKRKLPPRRPPPFGPAIRRTGACYPVYYNVRFCVLSISAEKCNKFFMFSPFHAIYKKRL